jgi:Tfp pilus assembly protein PilF
MPIIVFALLLFFQADPVADGLKALEEKRYADAVALFEKAVAADGKDYSVHFHLALANSLLNKDDVAIVEYKKALELKPGLYQAELNLGMVLLRQKQAAEAEGHLEAAAKQKLDQYRPSVYTAEAALQAGHAEKAEEYFRKASALDPKSAAAESGLARAIAKQNRLDDAAPHYRKAAELDPSYRDSLLELGSLYEQQKKMAEAIEIYQQFPENAAVKERLGELLLESGKTEAAIADLEEAVRKSPSPANRFALATAYQMEKHPEKAEPLLAAALKDEPGNIDLHASYGRSLRDQKKYAPAEQEFSRVVEARPQSLEAWGDLSAMLILLNQDAQALAALDKIRALGGEKPGHFYFRAIILDRNKQLKGALENYEKFLSVSDGKNPDEEFKARQRVRIIKNELARR